MQSFDKLGQLVSRLWQEENYLEEEFPTVACRALAEMPPAANISLWDILQGALLSEEMPIQTDLQASFGQPPLTVYWGRDFRIEVLFWTTGVPDIHQHAFSGAFHVLHGSSLHTTWTFESDVTITRRLLLGQAALQRAELLKAGATAPIIAGQRFIHGTFHLERPTLSVVVRTNLEFQALPQYQYLLPTIAFAPSSAVLPDRDVPPIITRKSQLLAMLLRSGRHIEFSELIRHVLSTADPLAVFHYLLNIYPLISDSMEREDLLLIAARRHPQLVQALKPALEQLERRGNIIAIRHAIEDPDLQFFLALLLNLPDRRSILELVQERYPYHEPVTLIMKWATVLADSGALGPFNPEWMVMLRCLLSDSTDSNMQEQLRENNPESTLVNDVVLRTETSKALRSIVLFRPLFISERSKMGLTVGVGV